jgi:hypothetical protein
MALSTMLYKQKLILIHPKTDELGIAEIKVWKVPKDEHYKEGIKYSLFFVLKDSGVVILGYDNHRPKGHHRHSGNNEEKYSFKGIEQLMDEFFSEIKLKGFI